MGLKQIMGDEAFYEHCRKRNEQHALNPYQAHPGYFIVEPTAKDLMSKGPHDIPTYIRDTD